MKDAERMEHARWVLERNVGWIAQAEVKVAVVVSLDVAMVSALAAAFTTTSNKTVEAIVLTVICGVLMVAAFASAFMVVRPRVGGPGTSFIFFGRVAERDGVVYGEEFARASAAQFISDLAAQIHRNAEIAGEKHEWVRKAIMWSFAAGACWVPAIALLSKAGGGAAAAG